METEQDQWDRALAREEVRAFAAITVRLDTSIVEPQICLAVAVTLLQVADEATDTGITQQAFPAG